jgi:transcriptional regulator with XRE-family HTH domain
MKKTNMERVKQTEYELTILKPLRNSIEKAGGRLALAKKIGVSTSNLTGILSGKHIMKIPTLMKICDAVGVTLVFMDMRSGLPPYTEESYQKTMEYLRNGFKDDERQRETLKRFMDY